MCFKGKIHAMETHQVCSCEVQELEGYLCVVNEANLLKTNKLAFQLLKIYFFNFLSNCVSN